MLKSNFVFNVASSYHPSKVKPSFVGAGVGSVAFSPAFTFCDATDVPPFTSKVTVYVTTGMSSQIAYTVLFSVISTLVTISPAVVNDQPLNCFPLGAVKPFAGKVYSPVKSVFGVIEPVPPFASNVNVYLFSIHFA